ncbi:MAG: hypothetical protein ABJB98_04855 [Actinomycetota bacterium]
MPADRQRNSAVSRTLSELADRAELWLASLDALPFDKGKITKLQRVISHRRRRLTAAQ